MPVAARPADPTAHKGEEDNKHNEESDAAQYEDDRHGVAAAGRLGNRVACAFVFAPGRGENRGHACAQAAVEIAVAEPRLQLVINDLLGQRIRQRAFQAVADLQIHLMVLDEHEQHRPVVLRLLPHLPRLGHSHGIVLDGGVRLHLRIHRHQDLV